MKSRDFIEIGGLRFGVGDQIISSDYIRSPYDAEKYSKLIGNWLKEYRLDTLLLDIHKNMLDDNFPERHPFAFVAITKYVLLNCTMYGKFSSMPVGEFLKLINIIIELETYDPQFSKEIKINPEKAKASYLLKTIGKQLQWDRDISHMLSRTLYLYEELVNNDSTPEYIDSINYINDIVNSKFKNMFGLSLHEFIKIGAVLFAGSSNHKGGLRRDYFEKARDLGMPVPNDKIVRSCLNLITCSPTQFREDALLNRYNLNPLLRYPIIRIWEDSDAEEPFDDKFIAPIPKLILYRITIGLYYQLYNLFNEQFSTHFGKLFELYVSKLLGGFNLPSKIISEKEIDYHISYKGKKGAKPKRPDWTIFTEKGVILIECKATHYTHEMYERGVDAKNKACFNQIIKSLNQFDKFEQHIPELCKKLDIEYKEMKMQRLIVSFEPLWGLNDGPLKDYIGGKNRKDWTLIPIEILELVQPCIAKGADLWSFIEVYKKVSYHDIYNLIDKMNSVTNTTEEDSMFYAYRYKIFDELLKDIEYDNGYNET